MALYNVCYIENLVRTYQVEAESIQEAEDRLFYAVERGYVVLDSDYDFLEGSGHVYVEPIDEGEDGLFPDLNEFIAQSEKQ